MRNIIGKVAPTAAAVAVATVLSAGGGAYAAHLIGSGDIKDGAVRSPDIHNGGIQQVDLAPSVVKKLNAKSKPGPKGATGATGATGAKGATGARGAQGPAGKNGVDGKNGKDGLDGAFYSVSYYDGNDVNAGAIATAGCDSVSGSQPAGTAGTDFVAIAGGSETLGLNGDKDIAHNTPVADSFPGRMDWTTNAPQAGRLDGWVIQFGGNAQSDKTNDKPDVAPDGVKIWALCVPSSSIQAKTTWTESDGYASGF